MRRRRRRSLEEEGIEENSVQYIRKTAELAPSFSLFYIFMPLSQKLHCARAESL
jgi:hypothetical protein